MPSIFRGTDRIRQQGCESDNMNLWIIQHNGARVRQQDCMSQHFVCESTRKWQERGTGDGQFQKLSWTQHWQRLSVLLLFWPWLLDSSREESDAMWFVTMKFVVLFLVLEGIHSFPTSSGWCLAAAEDLLGVQHWLAWHLERDAQLF